MQLTKKRTAVIVESRADDFKLLETLLESEGFKVHRAVTFKDGLTSIAAMKPDIVLTDIDLPDMSIRTFITRLREWYKQPVIALSHIAEGGDAIEFLDAGGDDYVLKPYAWDMLFARINAKLRRVATQETGDSWIEAGPVRMDPLRHEVFVSGELIPFTPKEYDLLRFFMVNANKTLTFRAILGAVWGPAHIDSTQYLRVYLGQIRSKIEDASPGGAAMLVSQSGVGYIFDVTAYKAAA